MKAESEDFAIEHRDAEQRAVLSGVMRLASPAAYEEALREVRDGLEHTKTYVVDISKVTFMNSAGITALSRLVLVARKDNKDLTFVGSEAVPWQRKTIPSLKKLYSNLKVQLA